MFNAKRMENFVREYGATIKIESEIVEGKVRWKASVVSQGKILAETTSEDLGMVPCDLATDFRKKVGAVMKEDREKLPSAQKDAIEKGIPGIAWKKDGFKGEPAGPPSIIPFRNE